MLDAEAAAGADAVFIQESLRAVADMESGPALRFGKVDVNAFAGHIAVKNRNHGHDGGLGAGIKVRLALRRDDRFALG